MERAQKTKAEGVSSTIVTDGSDAGSVKITYTSSRVTDDIDTPLIRNMGTNSIKNEEHNTLGGTSEKPLKIIVRIANVESRFTSAVSEFGDIKLTRSGVFVIVILCFERWCPTLTERPRKKQAVMVIAVDEKPSKVAFKKIREIPAVEEFVFLAM
ncbi:hypothetical protein Tco_0756704 [Tanacetum coccineum]